MKTHTDLLTLQENETMIKENAVPKKGKSSGIYDYPETRELVQLVQEASAVIRTKGELAFSDFRVPGSRWRRGDTYLFVLDPEALRAFKHSRKRGKRN